MRKTKSLIAILAIWPSLLLFAQNHFQRSIEGNDAGWAKVVLPNEMFGTVSSDFSDLRILGTNTDGDTIEAPYLLKILTDKISNKAIPFQQLNQSSNENGFFYTFEVATDQSFNELELNFAEDNFDWRIKLSGSQDQKDWFTILDDYRIVAIKNEQTDYRYSTLKFPTGKFAYLMIQINSKQAPTLLSANITERELLPGTTRKYDLKNWSVRENEKQTILDIQVKETVPISHLSIKVKDTYDFYRPIAITYLNDSIETPKGWKYTYRTLAKDILSSVGDQEFDFFPQVTNKIRLLIRNDDNEPLDVELIELSGNTHELWTRLKTGYQYQLQYGNHKLAAPNYDVSHFEDKIPTNLPLLKLGDEQAIAQTAKPEVAPLFQNQYWLWGILLAVILFLGRYTLSMMNNNKAS